MKTKTLLWVGVAVIILVAIAGGVWWELRPQVINFDDGSKLTLLAVDFGKEHKPPLVKGARSRGRSFNTTNDTLVVWVHQQYDSQDWHSFQYYAYDKDSVACVGNSGMNWAGNARQGNEVIGVQFSAFPRHEGRFYIRAQENGNGGQDMSDDKFVVSNPSRGPFTSWATQPLPDTEEDGGFTVTLKKLVAGAKGPYNRGGDDDDPINKGVQATFHAELNGTNASDWQPVAIETSDATGNSVTGWLNAQPQGGDCLATYQYGLWPDESAWKLRVEFSKQANFNDNELWILQGIPLQPGRQRDFWNYARGRKAQNNAVAQTDLAGLHLSLLPVEQFTNMPPNSQPQGGLSIEIQPSLPEGTRLTIVKLTDDQGNDIQYWNYGNNQVNKGQYFRYGLQNLDGVTNVNLTLAVHKSHFVEFTVKPTTAPAESDQANQQ